MRVIRTRGCVGVEETGHDVAFRCDILSFLLGEAPEVLK